MQPPEVDSSVFNLRFTGHDVARANDEWGCNCGPAALAAALRLTLDEAREAMPDFEDKCYTSPSMMENALRRLGVRWIDRRGDARSAVPKCFPPAGLVRVQWCGPWTAPGSNPKWAYIHTHWIAVRHEGDGDPLVYDCNAGVTSYATWLCDVVPRLIPNRGDGKWYPTHLWEIPL